MQKNKLAWIFFVARRFANVDKSGRSSMTTRLASLGICFGVMTLIVVISVMNGFQMSFIDAIMEVSSYHVRVSNVPVEKTADFLEFCKNDERITSCTPFWEAQSLISGNDSKEAAALVRAVPENIFEIDAGFKREMNIVRGGFDLTSSGGKYSIILGASLASQLGVRLGDTVNLFALSGGSDVELLSDKRIFTVTGIFHTGYADINSGYAFISLAAGKKYFGENERLLYGIKLSDSSRSGRVIQSLQTAFPESSEEGWESYNRSFFGALRVEKNMLMLLVFLIFVVVCINIFNGMRRIVYERRTEISILSALGGKNSMIQSIFIFRGFLTGLYGAVPGLILGLLIAVNMGSIFSALSAVIYNVQYFFTLLCMPDAAQYIHENPMYLLYAKLPARIVMHEVLVITVFGIVSSLAASWLASSSILQLKAAEVLHDE